MANLTKARIYGVNSSSVILKAGGVNLDYGKTEITQRDINVWSVQGLVYQSEGADNSASGTSGWAQWNMPDDPKTWIRVIFDSPFNGDNSASIQTSGDNFNNLFDSTIVKPETRGECIVILMIQGK